MRPTTEDPRRVPNSVGPTGRAAPCPAAAGPDGTDPGEVACLTAGEAADLFPALALELRLHGYLYPGAWFGAREEREAMAAPRWGA